jgi:hypothetical protein
VNFFFDRNCPERAARMIIGYEASHRVVYLDDEFRPETPDIDWLQALSKRPDQWAVISGDGAILRNQAERSVLRETNLTFFVLAKNWWNGEFHSRAVQLLKVWPFIVQAALNARKPTVWKVPISSPQLDRIGLTSEL